jgi:peptide/nickel transport system substrate-binding protein
LNYGINRKALVDGPLAGKGSEASTPMPDVLTEFVEPTATYPYDVTRALDRLSEGGWLPGTNGMRMKNGQPAAFTLLYHGGDTLARDLATAFAAAARGIGVAVTPQAVDTPALLARSAKDAVLVDFGDPFDPDLRLFDLLHSGTSPTIDAALESGRTATDPAQRATAYRKLQRAYLEAPSMIVLVAPEHTYVMRDNWNGYQPVVDADSADFTWGAWWNLNKWTPR